MDIAADHDELQVGGSFWPSTSDSRRKHTYLASQSVSHWLVSRETLNPAGYSSTHRSLSRAHEGTSRPAKKSAISRSALFVASDPCIKLRPVINPRSPRIVPDAASTGLVFPMVERVTATAFGPSSTINTTGPDVM